jgi:hypothetical protein
MGDVVIVDTSVFGALNRQNSAPIIAKDLQDMLDRGDQLVVPSSTYQEIQNTPDQALKRAQLQQIADFKMTIQQKTTLGNRVDLYDEAAKLPLNAQGIQAKDLPIISDVRIYMRGAGGRKVTLYTVERMINNKVALQRNYQIEFSDRSKQLQNLGPRIAYRPRGIVPRIVPTLKIMGKTVALTAAASIMQMIGAWLTRIAAEHSIKSDLEAIAARVYEEAILKHRGAIAEIQSRGKQPYANVTIALGHFTSVPMGDAVSGDHAPAAVLEHIGISEENINMPNRKVEKVDKAPITWGTIQRSTYSFDVAISDGEVAAFRLIMTEIKRWESPTDSDIVKADPALRTQIGKYWRQALVEVFGPSVEAEVLDAWMWPKWKRQ